MTNKIPVGPWIQQGVDLLTSRYDSQFRGLSNVLSLIIGEVIRLLMEIPPWGLILFVASVVFYTSRSYRDTLLYILGMSMILNLGYWNETLETLSLVLFSTLISIGIGIPVGILCAQNRVIYRIFQPVLDLMQTIPTFVYLIPTLMLFGLGLAPGVISTVIFAMPAPIRFTYLGMSRVPLSLIEVGDAFGSTRWQRLMTIEIPHARASIRAGISQCVMLSLSMVVIAALVGADGLGKPVVQALNTVNVSKGFEAGIVIVILAILLDRFLAPTNAEVSHG